MVITSHRSPDGDAIGSSLALQHALKKMGVTSKVVMPDAYAKFLHWMPGQEAVRFHDAEPDAVHAMVAGADVLFCLDYNAPSRAGGLTDAVKEASQRTDCTVVMIDHHQEPEPFADVMLSDPTTGSTCELIYRFFRLGTWAGPRPDIASCLYCGLITTGSFRFPQCSLPATTWPRPCSRGWTTSISSIYDACRLEQVQLTAYALSQSFKCSLSIAAPSSV